MPGRRAALRIVLALVAVGLLTTGLLSRAPAGARAAPPLPHQVLHGHAVTIADLHGHPAVIAFVASWCTPCREEAPALETFASSGAGRGRLVAVDYADYGDIQALIERYHWTFPVLADQSGSTGDAYGVLHLPIAVIINSAGRIVARQSGAQTVASLARALHAAGPG